MTQAFGAYEQSYPPEILRGYTAPVLVGAAARGAGSDDQEGDPVVDPTAPPPDLGPESNTPEGSVPVDATRTEPDGPAVVAVPADQLDEAESELLVGDGTGVALPQVDPSSYPPGAVDLPAATDDSEPERYTVTAGAPGMYQPAVSASERPRNVTELRKVARPATPGPWAEGEYVLVGTTGKRAHWSGEDWHGDESPGYPSGDDEPDAEA